MQALHKVALAVALIAATGLALASDPAPIGFLPAGYLDLVDVVPPAPIPQEPRGVADREVFRLTRALKGTPRWDMAVNDVASDTPSMMRDFACAADVALTPANAPKTAALLERVSRDSAAETNELKRYYKRKRPFLSERGEICVAADDQLAASYDYPSGHATRGWTWALVLAELADQRAAPILARGRAFGESRVVCGVHTMSAVEAGRLVASSTIAVVRTEPAYQDAVVAARRELEALRKSPANLPPQVCAAEQALVSQPIYR